VFFPLLPGENIPPITAVSILFRLLRTVMLIDSFVLPVKKGIQQHPEHPGFPLARA